MSATFWNASKKELVTMMVVLEEGARQRQIDIVKPSTKSLGKQLHFENAFLPEAFMSSAKLTCHELLLVCHTPYKNRHIPKNANGNSLLEHCTWPIIRTESLMQLR